MLLGLVTLAAVAVALLLTYAPRVVPWTGAGAVVVAAAGGRRRVGGVDAGVTPGRRAGGTRLAMAHDTPPRIRPPARACETTANGCRIRSSRMAAESTGGWARHAPERRGGRGSITSFRSESSTSATRTIVFSSMFWT